uniref:Uncharacterized protein n=1 Tax=Cannabis sativa TaxID=3483 RepID=A0A803QWQ8_CANSA
MSFFITLFQNLRSLILRRFPFISQNQSQSQNQNQNQNRSQSQSQKKNQNRNQSQRWNRSQFTSHILFLRNHSLSSHILRSHFHHQNPRLIV